MKDRLKKKAEKRKRAMVHELLDLVLDINGMEPRKQELTGCKPTVFLYYSGHISKVQVDIHSAGWEPGSYADKGTDTHVQSSSELEKALCVLREVRDFQRGGDGG